MFSNDTTIVDLLMETFIRMFPVRCASGVYYITHIFEHTAIVDLQMEPTTCHVFNEFRHRRFAHRFYSYLSNTAIMDLQMESMIYIFQT